MAQFNRQDSNKRSAFQYFVARHNATPTNMSVQSGDGTESKLKNDS